MLDQNTKKKNPQKQIFLPFPMASSLQIKNNRENGGTLRMVPLKINPIYTLYSGYLLGMSPF